MVRFALGPSEPSERKATAVATITSVAFHGVLIVGVVWVSSAVGNQPAAPEDARITLLEIVDELPPLPAEPAPPVPEDRGPTPAPPEIKMPRQPKPPAEPNRPRPEPPQAPDPQPDLGAESPELDAVSEGFETLPAPDTIPAEIAPLSKLEPVEPDSMGGSDKAAANQADAVGGTGGGAVDVEAGPTVTPFTEAPQLKNPGAVEKALREHYPRLLRKAGIGGVVELWILIDESGAVLKTQVRVSSGREALDRAADSVAETMSFTPALYSGRPVKAWLTVPIVFEAR